TITSKHTFNLIPHYVRDRERQRDRETVLWSRALSLWHTQRRAALLRKVRLRVATWSPFASSNVVTMCHHQSPPFSFVPTEGPRSPTSVNRSLRCKSQSPVLTMLHCCSVATRPIASSNVITNVARHVLALTCSLTCSLVVVHTKS